MKNINRDYLVTVDVKTAKMTPAPKDMKFFTTDVLTSNIFFRLEGLETFIDASTDDKIDEEVNDSINDHFKENTDLYTLTLRVVKPNNEPKTIEVVQLDQGTNIYIADLTVDFVDIPGIYECELFIDTTINERQERSTTDPFEYEVKKSIFYNLDDIIDTKYISIEDIATVDYVNSLAVGGVSLEGYATDEQLSAKADKEHTHDDYVTQAVLDDTIRGIDCANINLDDFVANNSLSINRKEYSVIGQYSTAEGYNTIASGDGSHAEGRNTTASGDYSHAEGYSTTASNYYSHAEGSNTTADGYASHAEGYHTIAKSNYQHVQGKYNIENINDYAHIVGNGTSDARSNAHTLDWNGNGWFLGDVFVGGDSQYFNSKKLATEDYVNESVDNINIGNYVTERAFNNALANKSDKNHTHDEYATTEYVDGVIQGNINMDGYVTDEEFNGALLNKANKEHTHDEYITQAELDEALGDIDTDIDTDNLVITNSISMGRKEDTTIGAGSVAVGRNVEASGYCSHAEGSGTTASKDNSHAEGCKTTAEGFASHAEGDETTTSGIASHAEGWSTRAKGDYSHAEGTSTEASGEASHTEGQFTRARGKGSHAEGYGFRWLISANEAEIEHNVASGFGSHAEGGGTEASGEYQHVQGRLNIIDSSYAHIVGNGEWNQEAQNIVRSNAHTLDWDGNGWFAGDVFVGGTSQSEGSKLATETYVNEAIDTNDLVVSNSISMGRIADTTVGPKSTALGNSVTASGYGSHAEGQATTASGSFSHAEGSTTTASGSFSHAEGGFTTASSQYSHAEGCGTIALSSNQHTQGKYNIEDAVGTYAHIVGNGTSSARSNAHTLDWDGRAWFAEGVYVGGTSQSDGNKLLSTADIKFTADGKLSVTINGVTKTFSPD